MAGLRAFCWHPHALLLCAATPEEAPNIPGEVPVLCESPFHLTLQHLLSRLDVLQNSSYISMGRRSAKNSKNAAVSDPPAVQHAWHKILQAIATRPFLLDHIARCLFPDSRNLVTENLWELANKYLPVPPSPHCDIFSDFLGQCSRSGGCVPKEVGKAAADFRAARAQYQRLRKSVVHQCRLDITGSSDADVQKRSAFLAKCKRVTVEKHATPYPPPQHWVAEGPKAYFKWKTWCSSHKLHDKREGHWPVHRLCKDKLAYVAEADESVLFYDPDGNLVGFVI
ncbi:uncharacterized protein TRAVEDRAFT_41122, partial [Trametes versicolor FP-101664 SS1]|uniref:uncharacterized protein n=1 Tax=Trametes versicolor (strain FP-101664) TaxID=717944 RepID=UPI00046238B7